MECIYLFTAHITDSFMVVYNSLLGEIECQLVKAPLAATYDTGFAPW